MKRAILAAAVAMGLAGGPFAASAPAQSETAGDAFRQGMALKKAGRPGEAVGHLERALELSERTPGGEHSETAKYLNFLALQYAAMGRYAEAEPLYKRALAILENIHGPDHPLVAVNLGNLAMLYQAQGRYGEAVPMMKRSLAIDDRTLGPEHPQVAMGLNNLGMLYRQLERHGLAEKLFKRALEITENVHGPDHSNLAKLLNNLAFLYHGQERYGEAEPLYQRALEIMGKSLGPNHPTFATATDNYADMLRQSGRAADAAKVEAGATGGPASPPQTASIVEAMGGKAIAGADFQNLDAAALGPLIEAVMPPARDSLDEIREALDSGEFDKALELLVPLAGRGGPEAQVLLGDLYEEGRGVYINHSMAWQWYTRAGEKGDAEAQFKTGTLHQKGLGVPLYIGKAIEWYRRAAEQDHREAQTALGLIYSGNLVGGHVDRKEAEKWLTMAVEQGSAEAMGILENMYVKGFLPRPAERPAPGQEDGREGEAAFVRRAVTDILDAFVSGFAFKKFNGRVEVNLIRGGSFDVTAPSIRVRNSDGASVFIDSFKVNFDPEKRTPNKKAKETDGGEAKGVPPDEGNEPSADAAAPDDIPEAYWVEVTLPKRIRFKLDKDGPMFTVAYEQRKYEGLWNRETGNFTDGLIRLKKLRISDPRETFVATADQFLATSKHEEPTPKRWNGADSYELSSISVNASGKKIIALKSVTVNDEFQGLDLAALSKAARRAAPGAAGETGGGGKSLDLATIEPPGGFTLNIALNKLTAFGKGNSKAAALEKLAFGVEAKEMDKPLASFALTYGHNALTSRLIEALNNFFPHDASFALTFERIPAGELAKTLIGSLLGGALGKPNPDLVAGLRAPLNQAKAEMALDVGLEATEAALKLNGKLGADSEAIYGVSGGFDLTVNGLGKFVKWASKDLGDPRQAANLAKASRLAVTEFDAKGKRTSKYRIEMTRQGKLLVNGRDVQEFFSTDEPVPVMAIGVKGMEPSSLALPDPKLEALIENYVAAVNAKDLARLKGLLKPEAAACVNEGNEKDYDGFVADEFALEITPGYRTGRGRIDPGKPLPFTGLVSYPIKPSHYITIDLEGPSAEPGATEIRLGATIVHHAVKRKGEWSLILGCPTPGGFERLRRARAGG